MNNESENTYNCIYFCPLSKECCKFDHIGEIRLHLLSVHCIEISKMTLEKRFQKWIKEFLEYEEFIIRYLTHLPESSDRHKIIIYEGCPVCENIFALCQNLNLKPPMVILTLKDCGEEELKKHISSDIKYYPYECKFCLDTGKEFRSHIKLEIIGHFLESHTSNLTDIKDDQISKSILEFKLETFENIFKIEELNKSQNMMTANQITSSSKLDEFSEEDKYIQEYKCLFCLKNFNNRFESIKHYRDHVVNDNSKMDGFKLNWINSFHDIQEDVNDFHGNYIFENNFIHCESCKIYQLIFGLNISNPEKNLLTLEEVIVSKLKYKTYVCKLCLRSDKEEGYYDMERFLTHLGGFHNIPIEALCTNSYRDYRRKRRNPISCVENLIQHAIVRVYDAAKQERENKRKRRLEEEFNRALALKPGPSN